MTDESPDKEIRHIVADSIGGVNHCPDCGSELDVNMDWDDIAEYDKECPDCGKQYLHHTIEYLVECQELGDREELVEQELPEILKSDIVEPDEDIDIYRPNVDLTMERLSEKSVFVSGDGGGDDGEIDYRYWFNADGDELSIKREIIQDVDKGSQFEKGDTVREKSEFEDIENSRMRIAREVEDVDTGETLYYLTHQSSNPDSRLVAERELEERYEKVENGE